MRDMCSLTSIFFPFLKRSVSRQKSGSVLVVDVKENAERCWTPSLVYSISRFTRVAIEIIVF